MTQPSHRADDLLLSDDTDAFICTFYEDHRPMRGAAALIDWRLRGLLSGFLKKGAISGRKDEIIYIPVLHGEKRRHLFLVGLGKSTETILPAETKAILDQLRQRLVNLKLSRVALSSSSFSFLSSADLKKRLKDFEITFSP